MVKSGHEGFLVSPERGLPEERAKGSIFGEDEQQEDGMPLRRREAGVTSRKNHWEASLYVSLPASITEL